MFKKLKSIKDLREKALLLALISMTVLMISFMICRFFGIGYFANVYKEHPVNIFISESILFILKFIEFLIIILTVSRIKFLKGLLISFIYTNLYWFINNQAIVFIFDLAYYLFIPFIFNKFDYKLVTKGLILAIVYFIYQLILLFARYSIDLTLKFNYFAMVASVIDYKAYITVIYLIIKLRRCKMEHNFESEEREIREFGGGGCTLIFGKFDKFCEIFGKIIIGIATLGIAPLVNHIVQKKKSSKENG